MVSVRRRRLRYLASTRFGARDKQANYRRRKRAGY